MILSPAAWSDDLGRALLRAFEDDQTAVDRVRDLCLSGGAQCWAVSADGASVGVLVTRAYGPELEIVAAHAWIRGLGLTGAMLPMIEAKAREMGMRAVRLDTFRPGMLKRCMDAGYRPLHFTVWKPL